MRKLVFLMIVLPFLALHQLPAASAHVSSESAQTRVVSDYMIQFDTSPFLPTPETDTMLIFSVQDLEGFNRNDVVSSVKIIMDGVEVQSYPKKLQESGDFALSHVFDRDGLCQVVLEIHEAPTPLIAEFEVTIYQESTVWIMSYGPFIVEGLALLAVAFFYRWGRRRQLGSLRRSQTDATVL